MDFKVVPIYRELPNTTLGKVCWSVGKFFYPPIVVERYILTQPAPLSIAEALAKYTANALSVFVMLILIFVPPILVTVFYVRRHQYKKRIAEKMRAWRKFYLALCQKFGSDRMSNIFRNADREWEEVPQSVMEKSAAGGASKPNLQEADVAAQKNAQEVVQGARPRTRRASYAYRDGVYDFESTSKRNLN